MTCAVHTVLSARCLSVSVYLCLIDSQYRTAAAFIDIDIRPPSLVQSTSSCTIVGKKFTEVTFVLGRVRYETWTRDTHVISSRLPPFRQESSRPNSS
ncbi:hypothetical protein J6590_047542 [Homalodisca vitripennis]|nr:hypothetical protein J6590_047542 [Homalodisca vitripennis]